MASIWDTTYGDTQRGIGWYPRRDPVRPSPSLWDYIEAAAMTPVPGVADVASGALAARDFGAGRWGQGLLNAAGTLPVVPALGQIFIGVRGANKAQKQALVTAQRMAKEGAGRDEIWNATMWYKGKDGKWRTELADRGMRLTGPVQDYQQADLDQLITHPGGMFEAAPYLRQTDVELTKGGRGASGEYIDRANKIKVTAPEDHPMRSGILHEAQHAIQQREGMARGGSPEMFTWKAFMEEAQRLSNQGVPADEIEKRLMELQIDPVGIYKRLLGEVDARNTQARMDMTLDQRRQFPPWSTWDVPEADQIVRMEGGPAMLRGLLGR